MQPNMNLIRQMQAKMMKIQEELGHETVESSAGGAVKIVMNGHQQVQSITIDPSAVDPDDVEMLQDLVMAAVNDAVTKSKELAAKRLGALTGGMKIPGLF